MDPLALASGFWIIMIVVFLVVEAATVSLVSVWFFAGSVAALIAARLGAPFWLQAALFSGVSAVLLGLLRPFIKRFLNPHLIPTNADVIIGKDAVVTEEISNLRESGAVKIRGLTWSARVAEEDAATTVPVGAVVSIIRLEGVKAIVRPP